MTFHVITIFPELIKPYFDGSILGRAQENKLIEVKFYNLRDFADDKDKNTGLRGDWKFGKVDDRPFGGGPGMVLKIEPIVKAISSILKSKVKSQKSKVQEKFQNFKIILFSPSGKQFNQKAAIELANPANGTSKYTDVIFVCGRYEGVDARLKSVLKDLFSSYKLLTTNYSLIEFSVGHYVLTGGELPAAIIIDAISRYIPGVLGKDESLELSRQKGGDERGVGIPVYTRPEIFERGNKKYRVPKVLMSGHQKNIEEWKKKNAAKFSL